MTELSAPQKAKIIWNCRRGMLELDILLSRFLQRYKDTLTGAQWRLLARLLELDDPSLYAQLMGYEAIDDGKLLPLIHMIQDGD
jgi:antitoxin CptB